MDVNFDGDGNLDVAADALTLKTFWSIAEVVALAGCQRSAAKSPLPSPSKFTLPTTTMTKSTVRDRSRTYDQASDDHAQDTASRARSPNAPEFADVVRMSGQHPLLLSAAHRSYSEPTGSTAP